MHRTIRFVPEPPEPTTPEPDWVVIEPLITAAEPTTPFLDIGVVLFDAGVAAADDTPMAAVRRLEAVLLARDLKKCWSAVIAGVRFVSCPRHPH